MRKFDVLRIGADLYLVVQAEHLLELNSVVLLPVLPIEALPGLRKLTIDIRIAGDPYRIRGAYAAHRGGASPAAPHTRPPTVPGRGAKDRKSVV